MGDVSPTLQQNSNLALQTHSTGDLNLEALPNEKILEEISDSPNKQKKLIFIILLLAISIYKLRNLFVRQTAKTLKKSEILAVTYPLAERIVAKFEETRSLTRIGELSALMDSKPLLSLKLKKKVYMKGEENNADFTEIKISSIADMRRAIAEELAKIYTTSEESKATSVDLDILNPEMAIQIAWTVKKSQIDKFKAKMLGNSNKYQTKNSQMTDTNTSNLYIRRFELIKSTLETNAMSSDIDGKSKGSDAGTYFMRGLSHFADLQRFSWEKPNLSLGSSLLATSGLLGKEDKKSAAQLISSIGYSIASQNYWSFAYNMNNLMLQNPKYTFFLYAMARTVLVLSGIVESGVVSSAINLPKRAQIIWDNMNQNSLRELVVLQVFSPSWIAEMTLWVLENKNIYSFNTQDGGLQKRQFRAKFELFKQKLDTGVDLRSKQEIDSDVYGLKSKNQTDLQSIVSIILDFIKEANSKNLIKKKSFQGILGPWAILPTPEIIIKNYFIENAFSFQYWFSSRGYGYNTLDSASLEKPSSMASSPSSSTFLTDWTGHSDLDELLEEQSNYIGSGISSVSSWWKMSSSTDDKTNKNKKDQETNLLSTIYQTLQQKMELQTMMKDMGEDELDQSQTSDLETSIVEYGQKSLRTIQELNSMSASYDDTSIMAHLGIPTDRESKKKFMLHACKWITFALLLLFVYKSWGARKRQQHLLIDTITNKIRRYFITNLKSDPVLMQGVWVLITKRNPETEQKREYSYLQQEKDKVKYALFDISSFTPLQIKIPTPTKTSKTETISIAFTETQKKTIFREYMLGASIEMIQIIT